MAKKVLEGNTKGYRSHSQLIRFRKSDAPLALINLYLSFVLEEAERRGYRFDRGKVDWDSCKDCKLRIRVSRGQVAFESSHLLAKLKVREPARYQLLIAEPPSRLHPIFVLVEGGIEEWEKV